MCKYKFKILATICVIVLLFSGCKQDKAFSTSVTAMGTVISFKLYGDNSENVFNALMQEFDKIFCSKC